MLWKPPQRKSKLPLVADMQPAEFNLPPPLGELAVTTTTLSSANLPRSGHPVQAVHQSLSLGDSFLVVCHPVSSCLPCHNITPFNPFPGCHRCALVPASPLRRCLARHHFPSTSFFCYRTLYALARQKRPSNSCRTDNGPFLPIPRCRHHIHPQASPMNLLPIRHSSILRYQPSLDPKRPLS